MTNFKIDPTSLAFDIDGVVADTMTLFLDIARDEYNIDGVRYEDITSYALEECLDIDATTIGAIISKLLDGNHAAPLKPIAGAPEVLTRLGRKYSPILFVTARPYPGRIHDWMLKHLSFDPAGIDVVTTGSFDGKAEVLLNRGISFFVEDRLETCFVLDKVGITPVLFKQPWNRGRHPFHEVDTWAELLSLIEL
ncbi:MAG: haloacid dehalogenase [Deltaproteobacteria bacterium]|nr:haloacid dehalogenase [Deltaproteobacteria bacterium]MBW2192173.1 haloacid dehalogenase [Deltaproteobacteria bacterium]